MFAGLVDGAAPAQCGSPCLGDQAGGSQGGRAHRRPAERTGPTADNLSTGPGLPGATWSGGGRVCAARRYAQEAFGSQVTIRIHRCTQLAHSTLDWPVFDLELEGVPEDWQGARLGAPDTRLPDRL